MRVIYSAALILFNISAASACGTGGSMARLQGVPDCGTVYEQSQERIHQQQLRAIQRQRELDEANAGSGRLPNTRDGWGRIGRTPPPEDRPADRRPRDEARNPIPPECQQFPAMCATYRR